MLQFYYMFKSQLESTDIYSEGSQAEYLLLKLESADPKWPFLFLNKEGSDFRIIHQGIVYPVHRNVIFKNMNLHVLDDGDNEAGLNAPENIKSELLTGVLSYLYGIDLRIFRSQVLHVLDVVHFLKVTKLKRLLQEDILNHFDDYDLFPLLERARMMSMNEVEQACLQQLDLEGFEQMRYAKYDLFFCSQNLFKDLLYRHNQRKWEDPTFGLADKTIQQLIHEYCKHNGFNERKKSQLIKSVNEMSVKSEQPLNGNMNIPQLKLKQGSQISIKIYTPRAVATESRISPLNYFKSIKSDDHEGTKSMIMDRNFMSTQRQRRKSSRGSQRQTQICTEVISLKESSKKHERMLEELKDSVQKMERSLDHKQTEASNNRIRLSQVQKLLEECQTQIMEDNRRARLLEAKFNRFRQKKMTRGEQIRDSVINEKKEDSSDDEQGQRKKEENPKDENLSVSLIQSKWVCC